MWMMWFQLLSPSFANIVRLCTTYTHQCVLNVVRVTLLGDATPPAYLNATERIEEMGGDKHSLTVVLL